MRTIGQVRGEEDNEATGIQVTTSNLQAQALKVWLNQAKFAHFQVIQHLHMKSGLSVSPLHM